MHMPKHTNHLAQETSPYLQQHAHNPVEWYPWGSLAIEKARREDKPILLSIGYAACHWCHVMAHESFENEDIAAVMNQLFINIKVDREERPDLDKVYQNAHSLLTQQSGGWPLTIFLSPDDLTPFFSGTYFPPTARYHLPAFKEILNAVAEIYHHRQQDIRAQNTSLLNLLRQQEDKISDITLTNHPIKAAITRLQQKFDPINGGFNGAPKFPQPSRLKFLLSQGSTIPITTLHQMSKGGIYDQLAGGFFRYSVDAQWQIPHFEKMLYDNAQLLLLCALSYEQNRSIIFPNVVHTTGHWIISTMQSADGGYYSSIDADSEGQEGKYYVWDKTELKALLTKDEYQIIQDHYGFNDPANFEHHWHLHISDSLTDIATKYNLSINTVNQLLISAKAKMLVARQQRVSPAIDNKILTSWNALMIKAMIIAGNKFEIPELIDSAYRALEFIYHNLWKNKRLLASYNSGLPAYLDDYVYLIDALIAALQFTWNTQHLLFAIDLTETLLNHFTDPTLGGFYFTANDHEKLIYRPKSMMDEVIPSGNGIAVNILLTLGYLLGENRYLEAAEKTLLAAWPMLLKFPAEHSCLLEGLQNFLEPPNIIILRGSNLDELNHWRTICQRPNNYVFIIPDNIQDLPSALSSKAATGKTCAYVCKGMQCLNVIDDHHQLKSFT